jgi:hypothetical protein
MTAPKTIALLLLLTLSCGAEDSGLRIDTSVPGQLEIRRGENGPALVACLATETHGRPYLHPLRSPDGKVVLTEFSPAHHKHQTGLYWGPTRINGRDYFHHYDPSYWANTKLMPLAGIGGAPPSWRTSSELLDEASKPVLRDTQIWSLTDHGTWYALDLHWTGEALVDVAIGHYDYGGLFLRMPWKPGTPAECINSEGQRNQAGEGQPAKWVDLAMKIDGMDEMAHLAMIDHPKNAGHPALWRIDDQFGIGPAIARRGDLAIPKGEKAQYRYRLVVYQGDFNRELIENESSALDDR